MGWGENGRDEGGKGVEWKLPVMRQSRDCITLTPTHPVGDVEEDVFRMDNIGPSVNHRGSVYILLIMYTNSL